MQTSFTAAEKDTFLLNAFSKLVNQGITSAWATTAHPFTDLRNECRQLMTDSTFVADLHAYLQRRPVIHGALSMFFTQIAMAARAQWQDVPDEIRPITARGWFLGRWIPTFLIIDGPIGRFLCGADSPLNVLLRKEYGQYPLLASARDFLNNKLFRRLRNGFGHWSFDWEVVHTESYVVAYDWENGTQTARLHQEEADAFHIIAFALIEVLDDVIIRQRNKV